MKKAELALKAYNAAKNTPDEGRRKGEMDAAMKNADVWNNSCGNTRALHRSYGTILSVVAFVGGLIFLVGAGMTLLGFRKKKLA